MKILRIGILLAFYLLLVSCDDIKTQSREKYLSAETIEDAQIEAEKVRELGAEGIPIFLEAIEKHIDSQDSLLSYGILLLSIKQLDILARNDVYSKKSVPVLVRVLKTQKSITDSLITANIIRIITGLDVGYNESFVKDYKSLDEIKRLNMISKWENYVEGMRTEKIP
jgi:hypothetical protein